jgi:hypothetical protein
LESLNSFTIFSHLILSFFMVFFFFLFCNFFLECLIAYCWSFRLSNWWLCTIFLFLILLLNNLKIVKCYYIWFYLW